jgi:threonine dehydratase
MIPAEWIQAAQERITAHIYRTPISYDPALNAWFKWENQQVTGSFKIRGALNKVLTLQPWERQRGLVTASAGNHGQGLAMAGALVGSPVVVYASEHAVPSKLAAMHTLGAEVRLVPGGYREAEQAALAHSAAQGATWVSPYNDGQIIAGQATVGLEILEDLPEFQEFTCLVPVGGGGLLAGISACLAEVGGEYRQIGVIGVQSAASPFMHSLFYHHHQQGVEELPSLADGLAGPVQQDSLTTPIIQRYCEQILLVSEAEIAQAIAYAWEHYSEKIEGSAAAALAALLYKHNIERPAVVIVSGGNIQPESHQEIIAANAGLSQQRN